MNPRFYMDEVLEKKVIGFINKKRFEEEFHNITKLIEGDLWSIKIIHYYLF